MMYERRECPVCATICSVGVYDYGDKLEVTCERCNRFKISLWALQSSDTNKYSNWRAQLSYYIKNENNPPELFKTSDINTILKNTLLPDYQTKYNNLLKWFGDVSENSTKTIDGFPNKLSSIIGANSPAEVVEILDEIWNACLIAMENPVEGPLRNKFPFSGFAAHLTDKGLRLISELNNTFLYPMPNNIEFNFEYDFVFSFAGEDRPFVRNITSKLKDKQIKYFCDEDEKVNLWGKDLAIYLDKIYQHSAKYCIIIISDNYRKKIWTNHELKSALARAIKEKNKEYILPIRLDDTDIDGIRHSLGYIDARKESIDDIVEFIIEKLKH